MKKGGGGGIECTSGNVVGGGRIQRLKKGGVGGHRVYIRECCRQGWIQRLKKEGGGGGGIECTSGNVVEKYQHYSHFAYFRPKSGISPTLKKNTQIKTEYNALLSIDGVPPKSRGCGFRLAMVIQILYDNPDGPNDSTLKYGGYQPYG